MSRLRTPLTKRTLFENVDVDDTTRTRARRRVFQTTMGSSIALVSCIREEATSFEVFDRRSFKDGGHTLARVLSARREHHISSAFPVGEREGRPRRPQQRDSVRRRHLARLLLLE